MKAKAKKTPRAGGKASESTALRKKAKTRVCSVTGKLVPTERVFLGSEIGRPRDERSHTRQIADALLCAIAAGDWKVGDILPSVASIARHLGVNPNTAARAYAVLAVDRACAPREGRWVVASRSKARDAVVSAVLEAERRAEEMRRLAGLP